MPRNRTQKVYSVYHHMEEKGVFETNTANAGAVNTDGLSIYQGPVEYPKMLYHPTGEMERIYAGIQVMDREGNPVKDENGQLKYAGSQHAIKTVIVHSADEEAEWIGRGWHTSEAAARRTNPVLAKTAPGPTPMEEAKSRIKELEAKLAERDAKADAKVGAK